MKVEEIKQEESAAVRRTSPSTIDPALSRGLAALPNWMPVKTSQSRVETGLRVYYGAQENPFNLREDDDALKTILQMSVAGAVPGMNYEATASTKDKVYQLVRFFALSCIPCSDCTSQHLGSSMLSYVGKVLHRLRPVDCQEGS